MRESTVFLGQIRKTGIWVGATGGSIMVGALILFFLSPLLKVWTGSNGFPGSPLFWEIKQYIKDVAWRDRNRIRGQED